jgi:hypothetical protein
MYRCPAPKLRTYPGPKLISKGNARSRNFSIVKLQSLVEYDARRNVPTAASLPVRVLRLVKVKALPATAAGKHRR